MAVQFRKPRLQEADFVAQQTVGDVLLALQVGRCHRYAESAEKVGGHLVLGEQEPKEADEAATGFGTEQVLHLTGVDLGVVLVHTEGVVEEFLQHQASGLRLPNDPHATVGKLQEAIGGCAHVATLLEVFHGRRDTAFGNLQILGHIGNAGVAVVGFELVDGHEVMGRTVGQLVGLVSLPEVLVHE